MIGRDVTARADGSAFDLRHTMSHPAPTRAVGHSYREHNRVSNDTPPDRILAVTSDRAAEIIGADGMAVVVRVGESEVVVDLGETVEDIAAVRVLPSLIPKRCGMRLQVQLGPTDVGNAVEYVVGGSSVLQPYAASVPHVQYTDAKYAYSATDGQLVVNENDYHQRMSAQIAPPIAIGSGNDTLTFRTVKLKWVSGNGSLVPPVNDSVVCGHMVTLEAPPAVVLTQHADAAAAWPRHWAGVWVGPHPGGAMLSPQPVGGTTTTIDTNLVQGSTHTVDAVTMTTVYDSVNTTSSAGVGATFKVTFQQNALGAATAVQSVVLVSPGRGYVTNAVVTLTMKQFDKTSDASTAVFKVKYPGLYLAIKSGASAVGSVVNTYRVYGSDAFTYDGGAATGGAVRVHFSAADASGTVTATATLERMGAGYTAGGRITISAAALGRAAGKPDLVIDVPATTNARLPTYADAVWEVGSKVAFHSGVNARARFEHVVVRLAPAGGNAADVNKEKRTYASVSLPHPHVLCTDSTGKVVAGAALGTTVFTVTTDASGNTTALLTRCGSAATASMAAGTITLQSAFFNTTTGSLPGSATSVSFTVTAVSEAFGDGASSGTAELHNHRHCRAATTPDFLDAHTWAGVLTADPNSNVDYATLRCKSKTAVTVDGVALVAKDRVLVHSFPAVVPPSGAAALTYISMVDGVSGSALTNVAPAAFNGVYEVTHVGSGGTGMVMRRVEDTAVLEYRRFVNVTEGQLHRGGTFVNTRPTPCLAGAGYNATLRSVLNAYERHVGDSRAVGMAGQSALIYPPHGQVTQAGEMMALYTSEAAARKADVAGLSSIEGPLVVGMDTTAVRARVRNAFVRDSVVVALCTPHHTPGVARAFGCLGKVRASHETSLRTAVAFADTTHTTARTYRHTHVRTPVETSGASVAVEQRVWGTDPTYTSTTPLTVRALAVGDDVLVYVSTGKIGATTAAQSGADNDPAAIGGGGRGFRVTGIVDVHRQEVALPPYAVRIALYRNGTLAS